MLKDPQPQDDIISIEGSNPDMDLVYQSDTTFLDITQQLVHSPTNKEEINYNKLQSSSNARIDNNTTNAQLLNASFSNTQINNLDYVTVTLNLDHVSISNANDAIDVAQIIDQVVASRDDQKDLYDSMHAPKRPSIVNLPPKDLRHHLNSL